MQEVVTYRGAVYTWHCDQIGHMNVMHYTGKFDEANWNLLLMLGVSPSYMRDSGCGMAAVEQRFAYKRELLAGDLVEVRTQVVEVGEKVVRFVHRMHNAETGVLAATCEAVGIHVDRTQRKACPFPAAIRAAAERFLVDGETQAAA